MAHMEPQMRPTSTAVLQTGGYWRVSCQLGSQMQRVFLKPCHEIQHQMKVPILNTVKSGRPNLVLGKESLNPKPNPQP